MAGSAYGAPADRDAWVALLRGHPFFAEAPAQALDDLVERCRVKRVRAGTMLFREGEPAFGMMLVRRGAVRVYRSLPDGRDAEVHRRGPGQGLAELPLLDGGPYPTSAVAVEDCELLVVPVTAFARFLPHHPNWAAALIRVLGGRLRELVEQVWFLSIPRVRARVATWLWREAVRQGPPFVGQRVPLRRQEDLAVRLGTTRESVARALAALERRGAIRRRRGACEIRDVVALRRATAVM
jgi:CRP/FNR family transcriptional regulator